MADRYAKLRAALPILIEEARREGGTNPRAQMIIDLLADYDEASARALHSDAVAQAAMEEAQRLRDMLIAVVHHLDSRTVGDNAPGHSHEIPGVWDSDNGDLAGKPCAWCALWREAKALAQEVPNAD